MIPPKSADDLLQRAQQIPGLTLDELAEKLTITVPADFSKDKGWGGTLLERALGATAGSRPVPDFPNLGIELKTLPISAQGIPQETTFVCVAPLTNMVGEQWQQCALRKKIAHVLWVPILAEKNLSPAQRQIGTPFLWKASVEQEHALQQDWEELMALLALGQINEINAHLGEYLQLRPKAAHGRITKQALGASGQLIQAQPKGFYLRTAFTQWILAEQFAPN